MDSMTSRPSRRAHQATALEEWATAVEPEALVPADTASLQAIAELTERRNELDRALLGAVQVARAERRSWSEIGAMLGVSKQAAQRKYAKATNK
ncbi:MAG: AsnC family protein [Actinobacteria bacterium]|nr:AsnC family protein [Actinomycetota bacterium]MCB9388330.1 AsnC family protein [Acidimicrobiia bacterium]